MRIKKDLYIKTPILDFKSAITAQKSDLIDMSVKTSTWISLAVKKSK